MGFFLVTSIHYQFYYIWVLISQVPIFIISYIDGLDSSYICTEGMVDKYDMKIV
jgi:hypothetical protein